MPPAARSFDPHVCSMHPIPDSPTSGIVMPRTDGPTVNIGYAPAARAGDAVQCLTGPKGTILVGDPTVRIEGKPAARMGDPVGHVEDPVTHLGIPTGIVEMGCPTVNIGTMAQVGALVSAAREGAPFCEECQKAASGQGTKDGA